LRRRVTARLCEPKTGNAFVLVRPPKTIDAALPAEFELHLVLDNYRTHKTPAIKRWLVRHPRFHLHFTPTGGSWLNLVERLFGLLTEKQLRRGVHRSIRELEEAIRSFPGTAQPRS
jgi:hypothetical protein